jgi:hypothetical protein
MLGYALTLVVALLGALSWAFMDLDAPSHFYSMFLPFAFVVSMLFCFVAIAVWIFWKFGAPASMNGGSYWCWPSDSSIYWPRSSSDVTSGSDSSAASSDSGNDAT